MVGKKRTALRNTAVHRHQVSAEEWATCTASREAIKLTQQRKFTYTEMNFTKKIHRNSIYLKNKQNMELTLPSALIVTSDILKVTFGFAVPIKTDVSSQAPIFVSKRTDLNCWIIVVLFILNWNRERAQCSLIKQNAAHVKNKEKSCCQSIHKKPYVVTSTYSEHFQCCCEVLPLHRPSSTHKLMHWGEVICLGHSVVLFKYLSSLW